MHRQVIPPNAMTTNKTTSPMKVAVVDTEVAAVVVKNECVGNVWFTSLLSSAVEYDKVGITSVTGVLFPNIEVFVKVSKVVSTGLSVAKVISAVKINVYTCYPIHFSQGTFFVKIF